MSLAPAQQDVTENSGGPFAADDPFVSVYHDRTHFGYRDSLGNIWDAWQDANGNWNLQQLNAGASARTNGPLAIVGPFIGVFHDQQHFVYIDDTGGLWDASYDGDSNWNLQRLNAGTNGKTSGPAALLLSTNNLVSIWNDPSNLQQHFTYLGVDRAIYDAFWDSNSNSWHLQKVTAGDLTSGPLAWSGPSVVSSKISNTSHTQTRTGIFGTRGMTVPVVGPATH